MHTFATHSKCLLPGAVNLSHSVQSFALCSARMKSIAPLMSTSFVVEGRRLKDSLSESMGQGLYITSSRNSA